LLVYVVGYQPALDPSGIGGFDWFPGSERKAAVAKLLECANAGDTHSVTFVPIDVPGSGRDEITTWIDNHRKLVEVGRR